MPQLVTQEEINLVLDETVSEERFDALYTVTRRVITSAYPVDVDGLTGLKAEIVAGVMTSVMARILANPKGARTLSAGAAAVTFGGNDAEITKIFSLNASERAALESALALDAVTPRTGAFTIRPF